jgi:hypothetical protein
MVLLRAHARAAAPAFVRTGLPVFGGFVLIAAVFFGPNGMTARDALTLMASSPLACAAGWLLWLLPSAPSAFAAFDPPGLDYLRTLPLGRARLWAVATASLLAAEAPVALFAARGGGPATALAAWLFAAAAHAQARAGLRGAAGLLGAAALGGLLLARPSGWAAAGLALPLAAWSTWRAFRLAPERAAARSSRRLPRTLGLSLAFTLLLGVVRGERLALGRALAVLVASALMAALVARNNAVLAPDPLARLALGFALPALTLALSAPVATLLAAERGARELLDGLGVAPRLRLAACALAAAALGVAAGACFALPLLAALQAPPLRVAAASLAAGACLGALLSGAHRYAFDRPGRSTHRLLLTVLTVAGAGGAAAAALGVASLPLLALASLSALWASLPLAARPLEPADAWGRAGR